MFKIFIRGWKFFTSERLLLFYAFSVFMIFLARNPFSERTLIPNLEPYPDTFHYLVPATSFVSGNGFNITRGFGDIKPGVPPLYSIALTPLFLINNDVRVFYFSNVIMSLASLYIFYLILKKLTPNRWIMGFCLLIFSTNYYLYWYPQWAMAENLLLPLFLSALYLLLQKVSPKHMLLSAILAASMYLTKYAAAPISLFYIFIYIFKILMERNGVRELPKYFFFLSIVGAPTLVFLYAYNNVNHLQELLDIVLHVFPGVFNNQQTISEGAKEWVSSYFLINNFPKYFKATLGDPERFLWDFSPILPRYLSIAGYAGLLLGACQKRTRFFSLALISLLFVQMVFISTFYAIDMRYLYNAIPTLILGSAILFIYLSDILSKKGAAKLLPTTIITIALFYSAINAIRFKNQIMLNLKYSEVPWYYKSVLVLNDFFTKNDFGKDKKPVVISSIPPFLIDYYSNGKYDVLPLSLSQEFRTNRDLVWGPGDYSNLHNLYRDYLKKGRLLYISTYGLGNDGGLHTAFNEIKSNFALKEVYDDCFKQCKIYSLTEDKK